MAANDNLKFWLSVEKTDPKDTKEAKISGRTITTIDSYTQLKNATKEWGMYGHTWGLIDIKHWEVKVGDNNTLGIITSTFFYPDGKFNISNSIKICYMTKKTKYNDSYLKVDDEYIKKLETNTVSKALSKLGFNADVFMGKFDDDRYVKQLEKDFNKSKTPIEELEAQVRALLISNPNEGHRITLNEHREAKTVDAKLLQNLIDNWNF